MLLCINLLLWCFFLGHGSGNKINIFEILFSFNWLIIFLASPLNIFTLFNSSSLSNSNKLAIPLTYGSQPIMPISLLFSICHFKCSPEPKPTSNQISLIWEPNNSEILSTSSDLITLLGKILFINKVFFYLTFFQLFCHVKF